MRLLFHQKYFFRLVDLGELDLDDLVHGSLDGAADEGGFDREFAMTAIDQHTKLHAAWASVIKERVKRGANGTSGKEDVIGEDDVLVGDIDADVGFLDYGARTESGEIIAVESDVEGADGDRFFLDAADELGQALCDGNAPALDADQSQVFGAAVLLHDFVGQ